MAREATHKIERSVIFRETFNDAFSVLANGGQATDVTFENGTVTIVNSTSRNRIIYNLTSNLIDFLINGGTFRLKFKTNAALEDRFLLFEYGANTFQLSLAGNRINVSHHTGVFYTGTLKSDNDYSLGTYYNVVVSHDGTSNSMRLFVNGIENTTAGSGLGGGFPDLLSIGSSSNFDSTNNMTFELLEVRKPILTAEEVKNLYEGKRFRELHSPDEILSVGASSGTISDRWGNTIVNTAVDIFKIGSTRVGKYDGSTSLLNIDSIVSTLSATETGTFMAWINTTDASVTQEIISFGDTDQDTRIQFDIDGAGLLRALVGESGVTKWALDTDAIAVKNNTWVRVALVQNGTEPVLYVNGEAVAQAFSTSTDKTYWFSDMAGLDNGRIGCGSWNSGGNATFYGGLIEDSRIINGILIARQINQAYTESKWMYGL